MQADRSGAVQPRPQVPSRPPLDTRGSDGLVSGGVKMDCPGLVHPCANAPPRPRAGRGAAALGPLRDVRPRRRPGRHTGGARPGVVRAWSAVAIPPTFGGMDSSRGASSAPPPFSRTTPAPAGRPCVRHTPVARVHLLPAPQGPAARPWVCSSSSRSAKRSPRYVARARARSHLSVVDVTPGPSSWTGPSRPSRLPGRNLRKPPGAGTGTVSRSCWLRQPGDGSPRQGALAEPTGHDPPRQEAWPERTETACIESNCPAILTMSRKHRSCMSGSPETQLPAKGGHARERR